MDPCAYMYILLFLRVLYALDNEGPQRWKTGCDANTSRKLSSYLFISANTNASHRIVTKFNFEAGGKVLYP